MTEKSKVGNLLTKMRKLDKIKVGPNGNWIIH